MRAISGNVGPMFVGSLLSLFRLALFHANCSLFQIGHFSCQLFSFSDWPFFMPTVPFLRLALFHANCLYICSAHNVNEVHAIISSHLIQSHLLIFTIIVSTTYVNISSYHQLQSYITITTTATCIMSSK